jgi:hypothetical protein
MTAAFVRTFWCGVVVLAVSQLSLSLSLSLSPPPFSPSETAHALRCPALQVRELKNALRDLQVTVSEVNAAKLQKEIDVNGDGVVSIPEVSAWWKAKQDKMNEFLCKDPTAEWGNSPATTSREVKSPSRRKSKYMSIWFEVHPSSFF